MSKFSEHMKKNEQTFIAVNKKTGLSVAEIDIKHKSILNTSKYEAWSLYDWLCHLNTKEGNHALHGIPKS